MAHSTDQAIGNFGTEIILLSNSHIPVKFLLASPFYNPSTFFFSMYFLNEQTFLIVWKGRF